MIITTIRITPTSGSPAPVYGRTDFKVLNLARNWKVYVVLHLMMMMMMMMMMMLMMMIRLTRNSGCSKEMTFLMENQERIVFLPRGKRKKIAKCRRLRLLGKCLIIDWSHFPPASNFSIVVTDLKVSTDLMSSTLGF